jgi:hypothetical protein
MEVWIREEIGNNIVHPNEEESREPAEMQWRVLERFGVIRFARGMTGKTGKTELPASV